MYSYIHDKERQIVYRIPLVPDVQEIVNRGKRTGWRVWCIIDATRADNYLDNQQWRHQTRHHARQIFNSNYTRDDVIAYFYSNHTPNGETIEEAEYDQLRATYNAAALNNTAYLRPNQQESTIMHR